MVNTNLKQKKFKKYLNPEIIETKESRHVFQKYKEISSNVEVAKAKIGLKLLRKEFPFDDVKLSIILQIILNSNFGETSSFKEELLQDGLITYMMPTRNVMKDFVLLDVLIESNYIDEAIKRVKEAFANLVMSEEELARKLHSTIATLVINYESSEQVNSMIQNYLIHYGKVIPNVKEILESITLQDVEDVIKRIVPKEMVVVKMDKDAN